ncbi:hypothetical protein D9757_000591 [Collybiopsis confluens]|uniref:Phosphomevalonate kinase n=1 Tax=Collybiopsis confluens TaxID=2823264 RepID=A0A8H5I1R9_9AGAR|nr:hypothetical protein D9757_000591 [Collybiopsis confluens]
MSHPTVVSAPGKVLIAGGYLVLDPAYSGVVVSTSSRFYTAISASTRGSNTIQVRSPQFNDSTWTYSVSSASVKPTDDAAGTNKFVQLALQHTVSFAFKTRGIEATDQILANGLDIVIVGDNDFYSQRAQLSALNLPRTMSSLSSIQPFCPQGVSLSKVHKTGLGSSAALITSLVSALLVHLEVIPSSALSDDEGNGRQLAHNLAQFIHCLAQGKVGSGFDVSAAVFGSHLYTRFDPSVIAPLMNDPSPDSISSTISPDNKAWNHRIQPFHLPPLTRMMLADIDHGSDTPSLVGKVLQWRKNNPEQAHTLWSRVDQLNQSLASALSHLSTLHFKNPKKYASIVKFISSLQPIQWVADPSLNEFEDDVASGFFKVHETSENIRKSMRQMGELADVPIEPPEQTNLLDMCCSQAGVIGGGVPGAGGYDAIWLLVCEPLECKPDQWPRERVEYVWSTYDQLDVSPLSAEENMGKGARPESIDEINGLRNATQQT